MTGVQTCALPISNGYVAPKSGHSRGSAVDLTLYRLDTGEVAAMGGGHDLMDERSHHGANEVSGAEAENRRTLCSLMDASGFEPSRSMASSPWLNQY